MTEQKQARAPWSYRQDRTIADADGVPLMRCYAGRGTEIAGPLAAAAPELLEALKELASKTPSDWGRAFARDFRVGEGPWGRARAAIAKAEGSAQ